MSEEIKLYDPPMDGTGRFCCPICLYWYDTREEKQKCMSKKHGYEILEVKPIAK